MTNQNCRLTKAPNANHKYVFSKSKNNVNLFKIFIQQVSETQCKYSTRNIPEVNKITLIYFKIYIGNW